MFKTELTVQATQSALIDVLAKLLQHRLECIGRDTNSTHNILTFQALDFRFVEAAIREKCQSNYSSFRLRAVDGVITHGVFLLV